VARRRRREERRVDGGVRFGGIVDDARACTLLRGGELEGSSPPINIGSGTGTRILDLARRVARLAECQPKIQLEPARPMEVTRLIANVERMREILLIDPPLDPLANLTELLPAPMAMLA